MIYTITNKSDNIGFEGLLKKAKSEIVDLSTTIPEKILKFSPTEFENCVFDNMVKASKDTIFEDTIELYGGHKFPDIVAGQFYGVEVKTTKNNHNRITGNSIFENTRLDSVENIYIFYGKLTSPIEFRIRKYEECIFDFAVTHSPRYLLNLDLPIGKTLFDSIGIPYNDLRKMENPFKPILERFKENLKRGQEPWWITPEVEEEEELKNPSIRLFSTIEKEEKDRIVNQIMILFPEIFGQEQTKYQRIALWLVSKHGIVDLNLRDKFTAGGQSEITMNGVRYYKVPRILINLITNLKDVLEILHQIPPAELSYYWKTALSSEKTLEEQWYSQIRDYSEVHFGDNFGVYLQALSNYYEDKPTPTFIRDEKIRYGI